MFSRSSLCGIASLCGVSSFILLTSCGQDLDRFQRRNQSHLTSNPDVLTTEEVDAYRVQANLCGARALMLGMAEMDNMPANIAGCLLTAGWEINNLRGALAKCHKEVINGDRNTPAIFNCLRGTLQSGTASLATLSALGALDKCHSHAFSDPIHQHLDRHVERFAKKLPVIRALYFCSKTALNGAMLLGKGVAAAQHARNEAAQSERDVSERALDFVRSSRLGAMAFRTGCYIKTEHDVDTAECKKRCASSAGTFQFGTEYTGEQSFSPTQKAVFQTTCEFGCTLTATASPTWMNDLFDYHVESDTPCRNYVEFTSKGWSVPRNMFRSLPLPMDQEGKAPHLMTAGEQNKNLLETKMQLLFAIDWLEKNIKKLDPKGDEPYLYQSQKALLNDARKFGYDVGSSGFDYVAKSIKPRQNTIDWYVDHADEKFAALAKSQDFDERIVGETFSSGSSWAPKANLQNANGKFGSVYLFMLSTASLQSYGKVKAYQHGDGFTGYDLMNFKREIQTYVDSLYGM